MRILLAGASGLIGSELARRARTDHDVRVLVRRPPATATEVQWDPASGALPAEEIANADAVISLSGASLAHLPWTKAYRAEIVRSRVQATAAIARAIRDSTEPPAVWVSASAVGFYGDRPGETLTEHATRGAGFLAETVSAWEDAAGPAASRTRLVFARTGLVLAGGGALAPLMLTTRLGLGSSLGSGRQFWPWISLADEARAILHLAASTTVSGPVNLASPEPATSREVTRALARALHRPHLFRLPGLALRAVMGRAADELLLADQHVLPRVLLDDGFVFETPRLEDGVAAALR